MDVSRMTSLECMVPTGSYSDQHEYPSSPTLSSSSSSSSVFSVDGRSSQSSAPSSSKTTSLVWEGEACSKNIQDAGSLVSTSRDPAIHPGLNSISGIQQYSIAPQARLNPRRTCHTSTSDSTDEGRHVSRQPPQLVRQCDRKDNFVESLVDTTTQMIEVIWPLSVVPCGKDAVLGGKNLIGLRTFIQEVLKRSKTSYSTLQIALYYLVLIKSRLPEMDFTKVQSEDSHAHRAMQCGRRMFLAALILASKYLQDRNYSARAWSKISGLKISEINMNEIAFVSAIDWKLHVPEALFHRWTDIVLRYSQSRPTSAYLHASHADLPTWRSIVPRLTPDLGTIDCVNTARSTPSVASQDRLGAGSMSPPQSSHSMTQMNSMKATASDSVKTKPCAIEPVLCATPESFRFPPISPGGCHMRDPQTASSAVESLTPASTCRTSKQTASAMSRTIKQINDQAIRRCTYEPFPCRNMSRDTSSSQACKSTKESNFIASTTSLVSSPESMVSDTSSLSRTSRSSSVSSISSAASSVGATPQHTRLAVVATRRCAAMGYAKEVANCERARTSPSWSQWTNRLTVPGMPQESYVRGMPDPSQFVTPLLGCSETDCARTRSCREGVAGHKRHRSSYSKSLVLQDELRMLLAASKHVSSEITEEAVTRDTRSACSFMLHDLPLASEAATLDSLSVLNKNCRDPRKRLCCH